MESKIIENGELKIENGENNSQLNIPLVRFPEFKDEWEVKKLGDISKITTGSTPSTSIKDYYNGDVHFVSPADIQGNRYIKKTIKKLTQLGLSKGRLIKKNNVVFVCIGSTIGKTAQVTEECITNQQINSLDGFVNYDNDFLFTLLEFNGKRIKLLAGVQAVPQINKTDFSNLSFNFPTLPEQKRIANFFTVLDNKINQLKEKKALLSAYKKGMMQKIFSQEIRFKDDDGKDFPEWEVKKLGEIATFSKGKGISKNDISINGKTECIRYGELYTHYNEIIFDIISKTNIDINNLVLSKENDVIIPASGEDRFDIATASCILKSDIAIGGDLNIIRSSYNGIFLSYYLNSVKKKEIANLAQGVSVVHLYSSQLSALKVDIPSIPEQTKIANFLSKIDDKIKTVNEQIEESKEYKKGLLQKMYCV